MKKLLFVVVAPLISLVIFAQASKEKITTQSYLTFHAGPSFPVGDFGSKNFANENAGFARTGITFNLNYGYQVLDEVGIMVSAFYGNNKLDNAAVGDEIELSGLKLDHWKWYGLTVGTGFMHNFNDDMAADFRVMIGAANANTPKIAYHGEVLVAEDWALTPVFQTGADLRIGIGNNLFIFTAVDYLYMKPKFKLEYTNLDDQLVTETINQKMSVLNLTGGLGIRF